MASESKPTQPDRATGGGAAVEVSAEREKAFGAKMCDILNYSALGAAMAIGHKVGLFDKLAEFDEPASTADIAAKSGLRERYVREWLSVMASGGVVDLYIQDGDDVQQFVSTTPSASSSSSSSSSPSTTLPPSSSLRFKLPREHASSLTRAAGAGNMAQYTEEMPLLTRNMDALCRCFSEGGGVPYAAFKDFDEWMSRVSAASMESKLVKDLIPKMGFQDALERGALVCDMGCGLGTVVMLLAAAFPKSHFVGADISASAIEGAISRAAKAGLTNVSFTVVDATQLVEAPAFATLRAACPPSFLDGRSEAEGVFDIVFAFDSVHDCAEPESMTLGISRALAAGGAFALVEITSSSSLAGNMTHPMAPFLYTVSMSYCMTVSLAQPGGVGVGMMWGREAIRETLGRVGFTDVREIPVDGFNSAFIGRMK